MMRLLGSAAIAAQRGSFLLAEELGLGIPNWLFGRKQEANFLPESRLAVDADGVCCTAADGAVASVRCGHLRYARIRTTCNGPRGSDAVWGLVGGESACTIPVGATGAEKPPGKLQALPGLDNRRFIQGMTDDDDESFTGWDSSAGEGEAGAMPSSPEPAVSIVQRQELGP